jgi:putative membrane protein
MKLAISTLTILGLMVLANGSPAGDKTTDKEFIVKVASGNNAEIEIGKLADSRAGSTAVKDYANMIVKDHQAAQQKLGELIKKRKIGVATGLEPDVRDEINRLSKMKGTEFDRAFLDHMIKDHKNDIKMFENQAKNGQEADVREFANSLLPDLRKHLQRAEELAKAK